MPTLKEFLSTFLGKTYNLPEEKVAELLNSEGTEVKPEAIETLLQLDVAKVAKIKSENFENGLKKATKEVMTDFEKKVKEKYGITSEKQGDELIEEIVKAKAGKPGTLEEDKVKAHPLYIKLQDESAKAVQAKEAEWKGKYETFEKTVSKKETFSEILKRANPLLEKFDLPKVQALKEAQLKLLTDELNKFEFQKNENDFVILDESGKVVEDGHGNRTNLENLVQSIAAKYWPKLEGKPRSGSGATNDTGDNGQSGNQWKGKVPTNDDEFSQAIGGAKTAEERIQITEAYDKSRAVN